MKIVFEGSEYQLSTLNDLLKVYPEAKQLVQFILDWQQNKTSFQFHTSGSTGSPKVIDVLREQIVASVMATGKYLGLKPEHRALLALNPNFVASIMMVARCLHLDMDLLLQRPTTNPIQQLDRSVDFASFVPMQIYKMIEVGDIEKISLIRQVLVGGAPLSTAAFVRLSNLKTNIYLTYGMTETVSHIALMPVKGSLKDACYEVLPGIDIGEDKDHCLHVTGAVTNHVSVQTNDIVTILMDHKFRWLGRRDHVINSGGIKIQPERVEEAIRPLLPDGVDCMVSWVPDENLGSACVLISENYALSKDEFKCLQDVVKETFSKHHIPKSNYTLEAFVRTPSGKLQRDTTRLNMLKLIQSA